MKLKFEPLDLERNAQLIVEFRADSFVESFGDANQLFGSDGKGDQRYLALLKERNAFVGSCVHVIDNGKIVGQIEMRRDASQSDSGYVNLFYLIPDYRGKGIGKHLDEYARDFFLGFGMNRATLNVSPTNLRAIRFYEKCGWHITERIHKSGVDVLVMQKVYRDR